MILRECKCGTKAYDSEDLELFTINKQSKHGRRNQCKECGAKATRKSLGYAERKKCAPKGTYSCVSSRNRYTKYGISEEQYKALMNDSNNSCKICGSKDRLVVDHCHNSLEVRGILCTKCNAGIGFLCDSLELLEKAIDYLNNSNRIIPFKEKMKL